MPLLVQSLAPSSLVFSKVCVCGKRQEHSSVGKRNETLGSCTGVRLIQRGIQSLTEKHMESVRDCMGEITAGGDKRKSWKHQWSDGTV